MSDANLRAPVTDGYCFVASSARVRQQIVNATPTRPKGFKMAHRDVGTVPSFIVPRRLVGVASHGEGDAALRCSLWRLWPFGTRLEIG